MLKSEKKNEKKIYKKKKKNTIGYTPPMNEKMKSRKYTKRFFFHLPSYKRNKTISKID